MSDEYEYHTERWTYTGARRGTKHAKIYSWLDADLNELEYAKLPASVIGGVYEIQVDRTKPDRTIVLQGSTKYTGKRYDDDDEARMKDIAGWRVLDVLADESIARERLERKAKSLNDNAFDEAVAPLRDLYNSFCHTRKDRHAFQAMVLSALNGW